jgi:hypothetical protein
MIKRIGVLVIMVAVAAAAFLIPRPAEPPEPLAGLVIERPGLASPVDASIWYCAWAQSNASRDSLLAIASLESAGASFTFPVAIPGEDPDTGSLQTVGPGAADMLLGEIARRGDSPFLIEFTNGPAAASVTVSGEVLASDACVSAGPDVWYFPGGSTMPGQELTLRLFNPFPETAKVTVSGVSEIGVEALGEFRAFSIGPRSWRDIDLDQELNSRQDLVISVSSDEGLIVPAMALRIDEDEAWWSGIGVSETWEFPVVGTTAMDGAIVVSNPGVSPVTVSVDVYTTEGRFLDAVVQEVAPDTPARIDLAGIADGAYGARVSATGPVTAAVVATGDAGVAVMPGVAAPARTWLLPGLRSAGLEEATLWLINTGEDAVTVTVSALTGGGLVGETISVDAGTIRAFGPVPEDGLGYLVESPSPISAAWSITGPAGVAYSSGVPAGDE